MRVGEVGAGPLIPADGTWPERVRRRARGIAVELGGFVALTALAPLVLALAAAVDLARWLVTRTPWTTTRIALLAWWFLLGELRGLAAVARAWALTGGPFGRGSARRRRMVYELRIRWARHHLRGVRRLFGLTIDVDGLEQAGPGPALLFLRHASLIDNLLPDALAGHAHGLGLRFVVKRELQASPAIDIGGRWIPTVFVRRGAADTAGDVARVRQIGEAIGPAEVVAIYPEGTRHTPAKLARAQAVLAERQPELAALAAGLRHVMPPRLGGPLALLDAARGADVVICAHTGFDGLATVRDVWAGGLVGRRIRVSFRRLPAATIPAGREERVRWLYERWHEVDAWVGEHRTDQPGAGELRAFYDRSYAATGDEMRRAVAWRALGAQGKAERVLRGLAGHGDGDALRVLDVGCGDGALLEQLRLRRPGWRLAGTEIVAAPVRAAQERNPQADVRLYDGEHLPWAAGAFDVAVLSHVLEHVPDPAATLREAARVARRVVVEVPLEANLSAARASKRAGAVALGHLHRFARADVHRHARAAGLSVETELTDPLPRAVHRFFATTPARRVAADARWLVRAALHRAAPRAAARVFTVHHLAVLAGSPGGMTSERDEPRVDQGLPEGISPEDVKDIERPGPYRDVGDPARRGETGEVGDTNVADLDDALASDPQPDTDADPGRAGS